MAEAVLCRDSVELSGRERSVLRSMAVRGTAAELYCELEAGHGHEHAAPLVRGEWWLRWWPGRRVLESVADCGAESEEGVACLAPGGHEGGHRFGPADAGWPGERR
ncbi:hypothetical protein [Amycolatopsis jiangsuensis]|uniref:Uncharacterized protein n=1 Tax=Amycolatopsis jiangsuensis TaxID=1181879 RepID=A0A840ILU7_9PSEU|nr:hypothetical protein [Amycolatopsis jiangsuensis]MBB4683296.1 hypothetical protein [Amycolatopsis jiangsuensis]